MSNPLSPYHFDKSHPFPILLLGPKQVGKSCVGRLLGQRLQLPFHDLADFNPTYWAAAGFDPLQQGRMRETDRWGGIFRYQMPFHALALERALSEHPSAVLEVPAAQAIYTDAELLARVQQVLRPYRHIFLLLYSKDVQLSLRVLGEREPPVSIAGRPFWEYAVKHPTHFLLAKQIVYTHGRTPDDIGAELLQRIDPAASVQLIGPVGAGKSTMADWLARRLQVPHISLDAICWRYHQEYEQQQRATQGEADRDFTRSLESEAAWEYGRQLALYAVRRVLQEHPHGIIDFGGFHSTFDTAQHVAQAQALLAPYPNVILLLPTADLDESIAILQERTRPTIDGVPLERLFYEHLSRNLLSAEVIYTAGKRPEAVVAEILERSPTLSSRAQG